MVAEEQGRRSRWMMRALEWNDPRARYPNIWHEGMPLHILAVDAVAHRLRLGDLVAIYHPSSKRHAERANRFLGISRVAGLKASDIPGFSWIDLATEHRFETGRDLGTAPRRVFMCCDPGWPPSEVELFQQVYDAAVADGWHPGDERRPSVSPRPPDERARETSRKPADERRSPSHAAPAPPPQASSPTPGARTFAGADYSGDMRDPREATWLALLELQEQSLRVIRLEPTGRHGLQAHLRDPDALLMHAEAIGLDFPFGVPLPFAEKLLEGPFPEEGWWALARKFERLTRPDYLVAIQKYRDSLGEPKRLTDERAQAFSPLHRVNPDLGPMTYHGIRMIAEERSRYAIKPFETARGKLLLEVYPGGLVRQMKLDTNGGERSRVEAIIDALGRMDYLPVIIDEAHLRVCRAKRDALDAVIAARMAAAAVLTGEADRPAETLAPEHGDRVRLEGWIYGLAQPEAPGS